ncbi:MAG: PHP domain-containing protein [Candidatus Hydrogenedentes bacterium]|nr:PHP domain-containing protein [Candidatus Hydrogenedentota bacterium]
MAATRQVLELQLNDFDPHIRREALETLFDQGRMGAIDLPPIGRDVNLHCHTFFSFNGYGMSPSAVAWKARLKGLAAVGLVDFDVLDGIDEFLSACALLGLRACAGLETRIFVPEFGTREINSPGEPGIAYFMGAGFVSSKLHEPGLLPHLKEMAQKRTRTIVERVNGVLGPIALDYECDVLTLTPNGNPTERHVCIAYDKKSQERFGDESVRAAFWSEKLGAPAESLIEMFKDAPVFQGLIRSKIMKAGGPGYVKPEGPDFPQLTNVARFFVNTGAVPTYAWLDGTTPGEQNIGELLDLMVKNGVAAVNIIPDRNWNLPDPDARAKKTRLLHEFVALAVDRDLPILVGTEINAYGQRFVDDFNADAMRPLVGPAYDAAMIFHAHTMLESTQGMGYASEWAKARFGTAGEKNEFYKTFGEHVTAASRAAIHTIGPEMSPSHVMASLQMGARK